MKTKFLILLAGSMLFFASCENDETLTPTPSDLTEAEAVAIADEVASVDADVAEVRELIGFGDGSITNGRIKHIGWSVAHIARHLERRWNNNDEDHGFELGDWNTCADITIFYSGTEHIFSITFDFGEDGCEQNGHFFKGKVTQTYARIENGFSHDVLFENLSKDEKTINGVYSEVGYWTVSATDNVETDSISDEWYTFNAEESFDLKVTRGEAFKTAVGGHSITVNREAYTVVEGKVEASNSNGGTFSYEVLESLIHYFSCDLHIPQDGILYIQKNANEVTIDFGDGECDRLVTVNGQFEIDLED